MSLRSLSVRQLRKELARREKGALKLVKKRDRLQKDLAAIMSELSALGVAGGGKRRGRPPGSKNKVKRGRRRKVGRPKGKRVKRAKNKMSLVEAVLKSVPVGGKTSPTKAAAGARRAGYRSSSPNFGMMTANTLAKDKRFKRLERGVYQRVA